MKKFAFATSVAAVALTLSGAAFAESDQDKQSVAPPQAASPEGIVFSKNPNLARPMEPVTAPGGLQAQPTKPLADGKLLRPALPGQAAPVPSSPVQAAQEPVPSSPVQAAQEPKPSAPAQASQEPPPAIPAAPALQLSAEDAAVSEQIKTLVETKLSRSVPREQDRAGLADFYKDRGFAPLWVGGGKALPRAQQAADYLRGVAADGLEPADYSTPKFDSADPEKLAADELAMTNAVMVFSRHASIGRTAFSRVSGAVYFDRKPPTAAEVLGRIAESRDVGATLDSFQPQHDAYKALKAQLAAAPAEIAPPPPAAKGKKRAKGKDAKAEEVPAHARPSTIIANMERWRWMPHDLGAAYVMVNVPDFSLKVVQDGKTVWQTKIVVGKPGSHATPLLTETMKYITVNPTWNVPPSIIRNEYLPALAQDPNALSRIGLKMGRNADGSIRIYQPPGEKNALGRIRFNFPNRFLVYQHDTPDKKLFAHTTRAYSHGCMRVENPDKYAEVLLGISQPEEKYTAQRVKAMYGSAERTIQFKTPIPVYITYQTAFADDGGQMQTRADIYGLDKDTLTVLNGDRKVADLPIRRNYNSSSKPVVASAPRRERDSFQSGWGWGDDNYRNGWRSAYQPRYRFGMW